MKIAIYPNYGSIYVPLFIKNQLLTKTWIQQRIEIATIVENLKSTHEEITQEIYDLFVTHNSNEVNALSYLKSSKNNGLIYVKESELKYGQTYMIQIVDVDTTKIWKIGEYDGAEGIEYFSEPKIIDKSLNLGEW